jgi:hypothetical protein
MRLSPFPVIEDERTISTETTALESAADLDLVRHDAWS